MSPGPSTEPFFRSWLRFWFSAADPSAMAFIRIATGLLLLYIHACYAYDLDSFFGRGAWIDLDTAEKERREAPNRIPSLTWEWNDRSPSAILPEEPHRRKAVLEWLKALPKDKAELRTKLKLLDARGILSPTGNDGNGYGDAQIRAGSVYVFTLGPDPTLRKGTLDAFVNKALRDKKEDFPAPLDSPLDHERQALARDLEGLASTLPGDLKTGTDERRYITNYFFELDSILRDNLLRFLRDLPADDAARAELIDYLGYWNYDKRHCSRVGLPIFSIWFHISDPTEMAFAHAAVMVVMLLFTLGLFTRVTAVLTWVAAVSYIHRDGQVLFGQDTMQNILLLYLMVANCGATYSLDRLILRYRAARASVGRSGTIDGATQRYLAVAPPSHSCGFAQRMLQIHFCFIYAASGLAKLKGNGWWDHTAVWGTIANPEFTPIHYGWYQELLRIAATSRPIYAVIAAVGAYFTLFTEITLPAVVWTRLRPYWVMLGMLLHLAIGVVMGLLVFSLFMMTMLLCFLPGSVIRAQFASAPPTQRFRFRFNAKSPGQSRAAAFVVAADWNGSVDLENAPEVTNVVWLAPNQPELSGIAAADAAFRNVAALRWLRPLLVVPVLGNRLKQVVAG